MSKTVDLYDQNKEKFMAKRSVFHFAQVFASFGLAATLTACPPPPPTCVLFLSPTTFSLQPGQSSEFNVSSSSTCSFSGNVALTIDNPSSYPFTVSFDPQSGAGTTSKGTISIPINTPFSTYNVTVRATAGGNSITGGLQVTVLK
jgi:hypothetical protein